MKRSRPSDDGDRPSPIDEEHLAIHNALYLAHRLRRELDAIKDEKIRKAVIKPANDKLLVLEQILDELYCSRE